MPYVPDKEWNEYKRKVEVLEKEVDKFNILFRNVKGAPPIVQVSQGKRFDLNENLDVIALMRKLKPFVVGSECTDLVTVIELANLIRAGGIDNGLYTET